MLPTDLRNATWHEIQDAVIGDLERVYDALRSIQPGATVRGLAASLGWELSSVAPRVTQLFQLGLVRLVGRERRRGVYAAIPMSEARASHELLRRAPTSEQLLAL